MNTEKISTKKIAINFGLAIAAYNIIVGLMLYFLDMHYQNNTTVSLINLAVIIIVIIYGIIYFKKSNEGYIQLSEALKAGLGMALISGIVTALYSIIMMNYIDPDFLDKSMEFQKEALLSKNPEITVEDADKIFDAQRKFTGPFSISAFIIIFNLIIGFIVSLIGGLILKKSRPE